MKPNPSALRQFGQATFPSSFLSKSSSTHHNEDLQAKPSKKKSISLSNFLNRKLGKSNGRSVQEKQCSFSPIGSDRKDLGTKRDEVGGGFVLDGAVFQQFNRSTKEEEGSAVMSSSDGAGGFQSESAGDGRDSRKRKNPFGVPSGFSNDEGRPSAPKYLVVLGDDPKPRPTKLGKKLADERSKPFYNHYANGCGWWDDNREGVDSEEVGCNEVWEGMGSTTLGGLEWH